MVNLYINWTVYIYKKFSTINIVENINRINNGVNFNDLDFYHSISPILYNKNFNDVLTNWSGRLAFG